MASKAAIIGAPWDESRKSIFSRVKQSFSSRLLPSGSIFHLIDPRSDVEWTIFERDAMCPEEGPRVPELARVQDVNNLEEFVRRRS